MPNFNEYLKDQLNDPEFKKEYDALEPEFSVIQAKINAHKAYELTQKRLSEWTGIAQAGISQAKS